MKFYFLQYKNQLLLLKNQSILFQGLFRLMFIIIFCEFFSSNSTIKESLHLTINELINLLQLFPQLKINLIKESFYSIFGIVFGDFILHILQNKENNVEVEIEIGRDIV